MWLSVIIAGIAAALAGWLVRLLAPRQHKTLLSLLAALAALTGTFFLWRQPTVLGPTSLWEQPPYRELALFAAMICGMAIRFLTSAIKLRRPELEKWRKAGRRGAKPAISFDTWEFIYPLLFSAVTFGALLTQVKSEALSLEKLLLSFQTGFFWQTLLATSGARGTTH
jgi:hypothetical protein